MRVAVWRAVALALVVTAGAAPAYGSPRDGAPSPAVTFARALAVNAQSAEDLVDRPDVSAAGVGLDENGSPVIVVYVDSDDVDLPATLGGVPVEAVISGGFHAQGCSSGITTFCPRPVNPGASAFFGGIVGAGTLGALVAKPNGDQYALSNHHVFADVLTIADEVGEDVLQPSRLDGGVPGSPHVLGVVAAVAPLVLCTLAPCPLNTVDAAIVGPTTSVQATTACGWVPSPTVVAPSIGAEIKKCGRTTGTTRGTVLSVDATVDVQFGAGSSARTARFVNQMITTNISAAGDSGSLVVDDANRPMGLLMAGDGNISVANPIGAVLDKLGVGVVGRDPSTCSSPGNGWGEQTVGGFATPSGAGSWLVRSNGRVTGSDGKGLYDDASCFGLSQPVISGAATAQGDGYWLIALDGGVFTFGGAPFFGSLGATPLNQPVFGLAATPSGDGYWLVARDGGMFTFGDAPFLGSLGAVALNQPITGMVASKSGNGYLLVARDGGIFAFGSVSFHGSLPGIGANGIADVVGVAPTPSGQGYWIVRTDGSIYTFGDAAYLGAPQLSGDNQVVGIYANPVTQGYRLVLASGATVGFGSAPG